MDYLRDLLSNSKSVAATWPALEIPEAVPVPWNTSDSNLYAIGLAAINNGLNVFVDAYASMDSGDKVEVFWDDAITPIASIVVTSENINQRLAFTLPEAGFMDGTFEPFYRITRMSGAALESTRRTIRVKLSIPGGRNPDPTSDYNANLRAPQLPDSVAKYGIDADQAVQGVDITIPVWPGMTEYDRIDFRWGGVPVIYTVDPAGVSVSVTLHIDEATILEAGDGQTLLMYKIIDLAANRSDGWSTVAEVDVFAGSTLDVPIIEKANGMTLDVALLDGQGAGVSVLATSPHFATGDTVELLWTGHPATGADISWGDQQVVASVPQALSFTVPASQVTAAVGGTATLSYTLIKTDGTRLRSKHAQLMVVDSGQQLPAPLVREADVDTLPPDTAQATVEIAAYQGMRAGDLVTLNWVGLTAESQTQSYSAQQTVTSSLVGKTLTFVVPGTTQIAPFSGGHVTVGYWVSPADNSQIVVSASLVLSIRIPQALLPAPDVAEAANGILAAEVKNATVEIKPWPDMTAGDYITLIWQGTDATGLSTDYQSSMPVSQSMVNRDIEFSVPGTEQILPLDGGYVTVRYRVEQISGEELLSERLTLQIGGHAATLAAPVVAEATDNILPADLSWATATIMPYDGMAVGDNVRLVWTGDISGEYQDSLPISRYTLNQNLPFRVYAENIAVNSRIQVSYIVERAAGGSNTSEILTLSIAGNTLLAAPIVDEAQNGAISIAALGSMGATARIPASAALQPGDVTLLNWTGSTLKSYSHVVTGKEANNALLTTIPLSVVQADKSRGVTLDYEVVRSDNTTDSSASSSYDIRS